MMLDALAAFVTLTIPTPGERKGGDRRRALLRSSPLPRCGRGAGGEVSHPPSPLASPSAPILRARKGSMVATLVFSVLRLLQLHRLLGCVRLALRQR